MARPLNVLVSDLLRKPLAPPPARIPPLAPEVRPGRTHRQSLTFLMADAVAIAASAFAAAALASAVGVSSGSLGWRPVAVGVVSFLSALAVSGAYRRSKGLVASGAGDGRSIWNGLVLGVVLASLASRAPVVAAPEEVRLEQALLIALFSVISIPAARLVVGWMTAHRRARRVLILGTGTVALSVAARLQHTPHVRVVGMVDDQPRDGAGVLGPPEELGHLCARHAVDDLVVAFSERPERETLELLRGLGPNVSVSVVPRLYELLSWRSTVTELHGLPLIDVAPAAHGGAGARVAKRTLDLVLAGAGLVLLAPVFVAVAAAIKLTSPGPVLFRQVRSGQHLRPFRIYKFRTMCRDAERQRAALDEHNEVDGPIFKMRNDPRVTAVGRLLRQTSLDELPQLINVLRGEMSLVGPRPFPVEESEKITGWATLRFSVPPGMTGLWQVSGRNALSYDDLRHLDYVYAASWSLAWDLRILLRTPMSVVRGTGVL